MFSLFRPRNQRRPKNEVLYHYLSYGQSHGFGLNSGVSLLQVPLSEHVLMFNGGISPALDSRKPLNPDRIDQFTPAHNEKFRESPVLAAAYYLSQQIESDILCSNHGSGGTKIESLMKDSIQYQNMLSAIERAQDICSAANIEYKILPIMFFHGGANATDKKADYKEKIRNLWSQMNCDIKNITRQSRDIMFVMQQNIGGETGIAQIELAVENPTAFKCQGPYYTQKFTDRFHLSSAGYIALGAYNARAAINDTWLPLYPIHAWLDRSTAVVEFHNPSGTPLVLDDRSVHNFKDGNFGFRWLDDERSATVTGVTAVGTDQVVLTLSNPPYGENPCIGIADIAEGSAKNGLSKRSCLRDSSHDTDKLGQPMYNWACIYQQPIESNIL